MNRTDETNDGLGTCSNSYQYIYNYNRDVTIALECC